MGLFDSIIHSTVNAAKNATESAIRQGTSKAVHSAVNKASDAVSNLGKEKNKEEKFKFSAIPSNVEELRKLPEAVLDTPYKTTALALLALCHYKDNPDETFEMFDFLNGPDAVLPSTRAMLEERLSEATYKPFSFFAGAKPENEYKPDEPFTITVSSNPHSFENENWAVMFVQSGGSDSLRQVTLRKKPSTGQWFINEIQCLADIRIPVSTDPWA